MRKELKAGIVITILLFVFIGIISKDETEQKVIETITVESSCPIQEKVECPITDSKKLIFLYEQALALDGQAFDIAGSNMLLIHEAAVAGANMDIAAIEAIADLVEYRTNEVNKLSNKKYLILAEIGALK